MTIIKTHNGSWDERDAINPLSSANQYCNNARTTLGLDTEMLVEAGKKEVVWPWKIGLPQERELESLATGGRSGSFDFHGDGYATELCVVPTHCLEEMIGHLGMAFSWLLANKRGADILAPAIYDIPTHIEKEAPEDAKRLGCMPSINVYGDAGIPSSLPSTRRTTGCHLHISHPNLKDEDTCIALIKWADVLVGCTWTYISPNPSKAEAERRKAYGKAGEYRLKQYPIWPASNLQAEYKNGVEYRVLPGTPINHPAYLTLMFSLYRSALQLASKYGDPEQSLSIQAKDAINNADKAKAKSVVRSLPITPEGRKLIRYLRRVPLKAKAAEWTTLGRGQRGHQFLYREQDLEHKRLTL